MTGSKRKESEAWQYYTIDENAKHIATCSLCSTKIARGKIDAAKKNYSVKGMWDYLKSKHKEEFKIVDAAREEHAKKKQKLDEEAWAANI